MKTIGITENNRIIGVVNFPKDEDAQIVFIRFLKMIYTIDTLELKSKGAKVILKDGKVYCCKYQITDLYTLDELI